MNQLRGYKRLLSRTIDALLLVPRRSDDFIVAGMATMPSRAATFPRALRSIIRQVDKLYLYLDGHSKLPEAARGDPRIVPIFSRDVPKLHANGKLLGLSLEQNACLYVTVDDDIYYYRDFVSSLRSALAMHNDAAVVGYHGSILAQPLVRYDLNRRKFAYTRGLDQPRCVDVLGTGAVMFSSSTLQFDVRKWPFENMVDLGLALEAARAGLPMMCAARDRDSVFLLGSNQKDSIRTALKNDDSRQTELARELFQVRRDRAMAIPLG